MKLADFDYHLPPERIAQHPLKERDRSRLLVLRREKRERVEARFCDLPNFLHPGDLLVLNDTRVRPLRLRGKKASSGQVEITLVQRLGDQTWEALLKTRHPRPGLRLFFSEGLEAEIIGQSGNEVRVSERGGAPLWRVRFSSERVEEILEKEGLVPLPPYIRRSEHTDPTLDRERYQTVYAREGEAAAAPTAGLHFTPRLLDQLAQRGVGLARVRLDVSYGTFSPVRTEEVEEHHMHPEKFDLPLATITAIQHTKASGKRVVAVGTTVVRVLEHAARTGFAPGVGETDLYIYPGFPFRVVDAMITNFHLPRSTLLLLVCAFAGRDFLLDSYRFALEKKYRFLSYGDAMLIL